MRDSGAIGAREMNTWSLVRIKPTDHFSALLQWCEDNESDGLFATGRTAFWFEKEVDAVLFTLRWA